MKDQRTERTTFEEALGPVWVQKSNQLELPLDGRGEAPSKERSGQTGPASSIETGSGTALMRQVLDGTNLRQALKRVRKNKGAPGIDGMRTDELPDYLRAHWDTIREDLLTGRYRPQAVRRHDIPKASGGTRTLGIPTVLDRFIQQALLQVLQPIYDRTFSDHSHGFRPGRSAHGAVKTAQRYIQEGRRWVVDIDLEKFFDRVNHDILLGRLAGRITDRGILRLIRRYLEAGVMADGVAVRRHRGTPQGGPLSPLLANILLDEVDQELESRGHTFVRYADDLRVFVNSKKAGDRVMRSLTKRFEKLHLTVNASKSAVARVWNRPFLGFAFWVAAGKKVRMRVSPDSLKTMKDRVRQITSRTSGRSLAHMATELREYLVGWKGYFRLAATPARFKAIDSWIRRRLRAAQLQQWKRGTTTYRELRKRGLSSDAAAVVAASTKRWWHTSGHLLNTALPTAYFHRLGLPQLASP